MDNRIYIGKQKIRLESIDSTNSYLKNILANSKPICEGTVIMAYDQYKGRGQQHNNWISRAGKNITMSFFVNVMLTLDKFFLLNKIFSLSVRSYLSRQLSAPVYIKWPNDFICDHKKICGLLIENIVNRKLINKSIVGIGLNVNQENFEGITGNIQATSMKNITKKHYDIEEVLDGLCDSINEEYSQFCNAKDNADYLSDLHLRYVNNLYCYNQEQEFLDTNRFNKFKASIINVLDTGELVLQTMSGQKHYPFKTIKLLV